MCGIASIIHLDGSAASSRSLVSMLEAMSHRGPDSTSTFVRDGVALGANRLAIQDVPRGRQPVWSEDGTVVAVCNGEIFNHVELRRRLEARGARFQTSCDIEIIPALYLEYGADFVRDLNGQFAIILYDFRSQRLVAARDRMGICPLFFSERDGRLFLASEIKGILSTSSTRPRIDPTGLDQLLTFPGPISPRTLFDGVNSLPPAHILVSEKGSVSCMQPYWDLAFDPQEMEGKPEDRLLDELEWLVQDAVSLRLQGDVAGGLYLSGGLDSTLVGAAMRRVQSTNSEIRSFSIDFEDSLLSERVHQEVAVKHLNSVHQLYLLETGRIPDHLGSAVWHSEMPLRESFNVATFALSEMAHRVGLKFVLAGQGADELFAGYVGYRFDAQALRRSRPRGKIEEAEINSRLWGDSTFVYERNYREFVSVRAALYSADLRSNLPVFDCTSSPILSLRALSNLSALNRRSYIDTKLRLSNHLLAGHGDRMAMAHGIEVRYPFLDNRIVDFASRLSDKMKLRGMTEKYLLKRLGARWIPREIVEREKFGFTGPGSAALFQFGSKQVADLLDEDRIRDQNYFDYAEVARLKAKYMKPGFKNWFEPDLLMTVMTFTLFKELFGLPNY